MGESSQKPIKIDGKLWDELDKWLHAEQAQKLGFHSKAQFVTQAVKELLERNKKGKNQEYDKILRYFTSIDFKLDEILKLQSDFFRENIIDENTGRYQNLAVTISLGRINVILDIIQDSVNSTMKIVKIKGEDNPERQISIAKKLMENEKRSYSDAIETMSKEANFLKGKMDPFIHTQIETIMQLIKKFSTNKLLPIHSSNIEALRIWNEEGREILQKSSELINKLEKQFKEKK